MRTLTTRRLLPEHAPRESGKPLISNQEILQNSEAVRKALYSAVDQLVPPDSLVLKSRMYMAVNAALPEIPLSTIGIETARAKLSELMRDPLLTKTEPDPRTWNPLGKAMRTAM